MTQFHPLIVTNVQKTIQDAIVVTLASQDNSSDFDFIQGQYLTFRKDFDGEELRRPYSICAGKDDGVLRVGIKRVMGGHFSNWANDTLKVGDTLDAMSPMGGFHTPIDPTSEKHYLVFAAGSGITPILSILKTTLMREPNSRFTLVYANRSVNSIMFREELEGIKNMFLGRFSITHILENNSQEIGLFTGRIDEEKCEALFKSWINIASVDMVFICGPEPMMLTTSKILRKYGLKDDQIKIELFASAQPSRGKPYQKPILAEGMVGKMTIILDGNAHEIRPPKEGQSILEAAVENKIGVPFACKAGVCATCKAKVLEGEVEMIANHALEDYEVKQGYVLTCQSYPVSGKVVVDYDV